MQLFNNLSEKDVRALYACVNHQAPANYARPEEYRATIDEKRDEKRLRRLFSGGQTMPSAKRQGKGNSLGDIGRFAPARRDVVIYAHSELYDNGRRIERAY